MNWNKLFGKNEILTPGDREALERLDESTKELRDLAARIDRDFPTSTNRENRVRELAAAVAERPQDAEAYRQMQIAAAMPSSHQHGFQHREWALGPVNERIEERLRPQHEIVRRVLRRALEQTEAELKKTEGRERKQAEEEGYSFSPSGRVIALQQRILGLRNAVAQPVPGEDGCIQSPGHWRERLREWL